MTAPGYYDASYPPEVWQRPLVAGATAEPRALSAATVSRTLTVAAGEPGTYEPEVSSTERPRNVTELREQARVANSDPWPAGAYVLVGTSGKRAHWTGEDWRTGESPGYAELVGDGTGEALPEIDPSSYPPDAVELEADDLALAADHESVDVSTGEVVEP